MNKRDFFRDMKQLLTDLKKQDESTVIRSEEKEINLGGKRPVLKKETVFRARAGIPGSNEGEGKRATGNRLPKNRR
ncbi:MAG: hypothetical protein EA344_12095 [Alkalicoccus sp.]|nr:MAG: hypothetical protein EA344_12095 [Alkalicoccus sp.]